MSLTNLTNEELAYIAGFIDGEGSIALRKYQHTISLTAANTDPRPIKWLKERCGGSIGRAGFSGKQTPYWRWTVYSKNASDLLKMLMPYLIVKKDQAEIAISVAELILDMKSSHTQHNDPQIIAIMEEARQVLSEQKRQFLGSREIKDKS